MDRFVYEREIIQMGAALNDTDRRKIYLYSSA